MRERHSNPEPAQARRVFFYDGDCGFCQWSAHRLRELTGQTLEIRPAWVGRVQTSVPPEIDRAVQQHIANEAVYWSPATLEQSGEGRDRREGAAGRGESGGLGETRESGESGAFDVFGGHRAIARALRENGGNRFIKWSGRVIELPGVSFVAALVYRLVAVNRHKLGPLVGERACALPQ